MLTFYLTLIDTPEQKNRFGKIYQSNKQLMLSLAYRILGDAYEAEDAVHDAFVRAAANMDTLERLNERQVKRYMVTAARHAAIDRYRRRSKRSSLEIPLEDPEALAAASQTADPAEYAVMEAVKGLPEHYREVFLLKYSLGLTNEEIAALLNLTVSGVKQRLARGKEKLKKRLEEGQIRL